MMTWPILSVVTFLPLVGALFISFAARRRRGGETQRALDRAVDDAHHLRGVAADPGGAVRPATAGFQFVEEKWLDRLRPIYKMGVDGISMLFVILTTFLMPFCILASWESIRRASRNT
jgi:NADH-quinone oxidoreductase subunit M